MGEGRGQIFHLGAGGELVALAESPFELEEHFEALIADHPGLLPGDQVYPENPRRWLVVGRQVEIPSESTSWALDLLLLDQDGIPTFVELKKGSNPELRRKVVGQMLDYAANAPIFWPPGALRSRFESRCAEQARDPAATLADELQIQTSPEEFWSAVDQNLKSRKIRLIFATDRMVPELRRVVEFLNRSMAEVEVLALELRRYSGGGHDTLVPTIFGRTLASEEKKAGSAQREMPWTRPEFLSAIERSQGGKAREIAESILDWAEPSATEIWWGQGSQVGSFGPIFLADSVRLFPFFVRTNGLVELQLRYLTRHPPLHSAQERDAFRERLNAILGIEIPIEKMDKYPSFKLELLGDPGRRALFLGEFLSVIEQIRSVREVGAGTA